MIRDRFQLPSSVNIRIPNGDDKACHSYADEVYFYEANFVSELRFPIHPFIRAFLPFATRSSLVNAKLMENSDLLYGDTDVCQWQRNHLDRRISTLLSFEKIQGFRLLGV